MIIFKCNSLRNVSLSLSLTVSVICVHACNVLQVDMQCLVGRREEAKCSQCVSLPGNLTVSNIWNKTKQQFQVSGSDLKFGNSSQEFSQLRSERHGQSYMLVQNSISTVSRILHVRYIMSCLMEPSNWAHLKEEWRKKVWSDVEAWQPEAELSVGKIRHMADRMRKRRCRWEGTKDSYHAEKRVTWKSEEYNRRLHVYPSLCCVFLTHSQMYMHSHLLI